MTWSSLLRHFYFYWLLSLKVSATHVTNKSIASISNRLDIIRHIEISLSTRCNSVRGCQTWSQDLVTGRREQLVLLKTHFDELEVRERFMYFRSKGSAARGTEILANAYRDLSLLEMGFHSVGCNVAAAEQEFAGRLMQSYGTQWNFRCVCSKGRSLFVKAGFLFGH